MNIIADANLSWDFVKELERLDLGTVIYINDKKNGYKTYSNMSDQSIMNLGYKLDAFICTCNIKHFSGYDKLVPLKSKKSTKKLIEETLKYFK